MFRLVLIVIFIAVPIAELAVLIQVGQAIGVGWTIVLLIADAVLGSMLARSQGRATWRRFNAALQAGRPPAREVLDGALVLFGGALLLTPGFITDVLGVLLLLPPTRAVFRAMLVRRFMDRMIASMSTPRQRPRHDYDIEGTPVDTGPQPPRRATSSGLARPGADRPAGPGRGTARGPAGTDRGRS